MAKQTKITEIKKSKKVKKPLPVPADKPKRAPSNLRFTAAILSMRLSGFARKLQLSSKFRIIFAVTSVIILIGTTLVWSYLGARLQQHNADQLADPLLFDGKTVFHGAAFPAQHSFLLKWPIFYAIKVLGYSPHAFIAATVGAATLTVVLFVALLYRIDHRPLVFGTLCLALASCLLLTPAVPYAGGLLPTNMAMITTRNLEYIVYIAGLGLLAMQPKLRSWQFGGAVLALGLVSASDRLFLDITIAAALLATICYGVRQHWTQVSLSINWLVAGLGAAVLALAGMSLLDSHGVVHIVGQATASPYSSVHGIKAVAEALVFGVLGIFTNFGANPAYNATILREVPQHVLHGMSSVSALGYAVNLLIMFGGVFITLRILYRGLFGAPSKQLIISRSLRLSTMMIWSSLAAAGLYLVTNHEYAVDSRYLAIVVFTVFICVASYSRGQRLQPGRLLIIAGICCLSLVAAIPQLQKAQSNNQRALASFDERNQRVALALRTHHTTTLLGDYWRVLPIKLAAAKQQTILASPLQTCTEPRTVLTSQAWQPKLSGHRFAYLLSLDKGLTDFPQCNLGEIIKKYGRPNATELIAGKLDKPNELLLYYDQGTNKPIRPEKKPTTVFPIALDDLQNTSCPVPTIMNIIAHEDDDLLFMNPDTLHDIQAGHCVRTIYLTAGDDGQGRGYWLSREQGAQAAYGEMAGNLNSWTQRTVKINDHGYVTIANLHANPKISLIFMRLPDGGLFGQGFGADRDESLRALQTGKIAAMHSVDGQSSFSSPDLTSVISQLMNVYRPTLIRTQSERQGERYTDHADHVATGQFATQAYTHYIQQQYGGQGSLPLNYYMGYPIREFAPNIGEADLAAKQSIFLHYAAFDGAVCHTEQACSETSTYGSYLRRQYQNPR